MIIESGKTTEAGFVRKEGAAISGKITAVNGELIAAPEKVNQDAHAAWMIRVDVKDSAEANGLLSAEAYEKFVAEEKEH